MVSQGLKPGLHPTSPSKQKTPQIAPYLNAFEARLRRASQIVLVLVLAFPLHPQRSKSPPIVLVIVLVLVLDL
jgi:hypothetical protein